MTDRRPEGITPAQTVGPFFHFMLTPHSYGVNEVFSPDLTAGTGLTGTVRIELRVLDADGVAMADAMAEIWQADADGRYSTAAAPDSGNLRPFQGFGRGDTNKDGLVTFTTIRPGPVPGQAGRKQAPHIAVNLFGRGMLNHLKTRFYFAGDPANSDDAILNLVPASRRGTLLLKQGTDGIWRQDIRLGGDAETVFFDV